MGFSPSEITSCLFLPKKGSFTSCMCFYTGQAIDGNCCFSLIMFVLVDCRVAFSCNLVVGFGDYLLMNPKWQRGMFVDSLILE
jgi:hypothetical protein